MPVNVSVLLHVKVLPSATAKVELVPGAVIAILLMLVAVAAPRDGVIKVGVFAPTKLPVPVLPERGRLSALFVDMNVP